MYYNAHISYIPTTHFDIDILALDCRYIWLGLKLTVGALEKTRKTLIPDRELTPWRDLAQSIRLVTRTHTLERAYVTLFTNRDLTVKVNLLLTLCGISAAHQCGPLSSSSFGGDYQSSCGGDYQVRFRLAILCFRETFVARLKAQTHYTCIRGKYLNISISATLAGDQTYCRNRPHSMCLVEYYNTHTSRTHTQPIYIPTYWHSSVCIFDLGWNSL